MTSLIKSVSLNVPRLYAASWDVDKSYNTSHRPPLCRSFVNTALITIVQHNINICWNVAQNNDYNILIYYSNDTIILDY